MTDPFAGRLKGLIASIKEARSELTFQAERIDAMEVETPAEREHLDDLRQGYSEANKYLGILERYQRGRAEANVSRGIDRE